MAQPRKSNYKKMTIQFVGLWWHLGVGWDLGLVGKIVL